MNKLYVFLFLSIFLSCAPQKTSPAPSCPNLVKTELYFGLKIPHGGEITAAQFNAFIDEYFVKQNIALTVINAEGKWENDATGQVEAEQSKAVFMLHDACDTAVNHKINRAIAHYNKVFSQQSVLRVEYKVEMKFVSKKE